MDTIPTDASDAWTQVLDESRADLAAGRVVDGWAMRQRIRDSVQQMEAELERESSDSPGP